MSQENIDVVLASIEAYNAEDLDAQIATYAPDAVIVFDPAQALAFGGDSLVGRETFRNEVNAAQQFFGARYKLSEVRAAGESQVLCRGEIGGIGAASGIEGYDRMSTLFTLRDGLITRLEFYRDHDEALKVAGLEE